MDGQERQGSFRPPGYGPWRRFPAGLLRGSTGPELGCAAWERACKVVCGIRFSPAGDLTAGSGASANLLPVTRGWVFIIEGPLSRAGASAANFAPALRMERKWKNEPVEPISLPRADPPLDPFW